MKRFFITGTDTDCGKTYITVELLKLINQSGQAQALKPVASGATLHEGQLINDDIQQLMAANANPSLVINQWLFASPIAPHVAAKQDNVVMDAASIQSFCEQPQFQAFDSLLIEGAGGICVPLNDDETWVDFLQLSQIPVILVVGIKLGCINHALLSAAMLLQKQIPCVGWIANCLQPQMLACTETIETLMVRMPISLLGIAQYGTSLVLNNNYRLI